MVIFRIENKKHDVSMQNNLGNVATVFQKEKEALQNENLFGSQIRTKYCVKA